MIDAGSLGLIAVDVLLDEMLPPRERRSGPPPQVTDAERICLAMAQVLLGYAGEQHWLRNARRHVGNLVPRILDQSGYTRRLRQLKPKILEATCSCPVRLHRVPSRLAPPGSKVADPSVSISMKPGPP